MLVFLQRRKLSQRTSVKCYLFMLLHRVSFLQRHHAPGYGAAVLALYRSKYKPCRTYGATISPAPLPELPFDAL